MVATGKTEFFSFFEFLNHGHQIYGMVTFKQFKDCAEDFLMPWIVKNFRSQQIDGIIKAFLVDKKSSDNKSLEFYCIGRHFAVGN